MLGIGPDGPLGASAPGTAEAPAGGSAVAPVVAGDGATATARPRAVGGGRLTEREAWVVLAAVDGLGPVTFGALLRALGGARQVLRAAAGPGGGARLVEAAATEGLRLGPDAAAAVAAARDGAKALLRRVAAAGIEPITADDVAYPPRLRAIELPPPVLFVAGDPAALASSRAVAVVGTRRPTDEGRRTASRISAALAAAGATIVSGLAIGIDGSAHAGALLADGVTVAVLGSGHARLYPAAHAELSREIVRTGGAVVAEVPPDAEPRPAGFPRRNRIIAGLADATIVVEAGERSGALITASWALEQGRAVFACPGSLERPQAAGCNRLIREQAGLVRIVAGIDELVEDLGYAVALPSRRRRRERSEAPQPDPGAIVARLGPAEAAVVRGLVGSAATADGLAASTDLPGAAVLAVLTRLEEQGLVVGTFGRYRLAGPLAGLLRPAGPRARRPLTGILPAAGTRPAGEGP